MLVLGVHTVSRGDTLFSIARRYNMSVDDVKKLNKLKSDDLRVGQSLKIYAGGGTPVPTPPPAPTPTPTPLPGPTPGGNTSATGFLAARQRFTLDVRQEGDFKRYFLTVPLSNGGAVAAIMRDNLTNSRFMLYPEGIMYPGQSLLALDLATIQSVGLTAHQARALQYVSVHEGKFDAINSYDRGIFSYGFIQFVGASAYGGSLNKLLGSMKKWAPALFQRVFQSVGIDVEGGLMTVQTESGRELAGDMAWSYVQRTVPLYGAFIEAGFEPLLVREQLRMANELYIQATLNAALNIPVNGVAVRVARLGDILSSEAALTAAFAICINQGVGGLMKIYTEAIGTIASQQRLNTAALLAQIDERAVTAQIANTALDERVRNRANGVLTSGLSFLK